MCECPIGWVKDEAVSGAHNSKPHTCREYIDSLEQVVERLDPQLLNTLQQSFGVTSRRKTETPASA